MATLMGRILAQLVIQGSDEDGVPFPVTPLRAIPFHALHRPVVQSLLGYHRIRDRIG
jgi:hypothetical protein